MQLHLFEAARQLGDLADYDRIIVAFSGGKDSLACLLHLLDLGVPKTRIELWHHDVDGREGSSLMDWPCTRSYCEAIAKALNIPIYFSWKTGGFEQEMLRDGQRTASTKFEEPGPSGWVQIKEVGGDKGRLGTRWKFPQVSRDLRVRWCSAYLKIDIADKALRSGRFDGLKTLFITGERAEESPGRARYAEFEIHRADARHGRKSRRVDHWRPVKSWPEIAVWDIIARYKINPHPAYRLGWGRVSCAACIFGSSNQWVSLREVNPRQFEAIASYEALFGVTIDRALSVEQQADRGRAYAALSPGLIAESKNTKWAGPVFLEDWQLPAGAFGEQTGPT